MIMQVEELRMIEQAAEDFARTAIAPHVRDWDERQHFPRELFASLGELGFMGVLVPETYGGAGLGYQEYVSIIDVLSRTDPSIGLSVAAHNSLCTNHIFEFGSEEQKRRYLPGLASGKWLGAWALTEPGTGSDAMRMRCVAVREGQYYRIDGVKNFITHGISADVYVVVARTGELLDKHGISAFIVEKGTPGLIPGKKEDKLGMRASETAQVHFEGCKVPVENRIGEEGMGFIQAMKVLDGGRISIAALALGIAKGAYEASVQYAQEREQFGQPIFDFQAVAFKLARMATLIEAAEGLIRKAAHLKNSGQRVTLHSAMAKYFASEMAVRIAEEAVQIHGGYGYTREYPVEKFYRDAKLCTIGEGTSEIQKLVISRQIQR